MSISLQTVILSGLFLGALVYIVCSYKHSRRFHHEITILTIQFREATETVQRLTAELSETKSQFNHSILYDSLTGLPSRQLFEDRFLQTLNQSKRHRLAFGVLFLDIDGFNVINDALGYAAGDELLKQVSVRILSVLRQVDTVCRFSGDEFVLLLPQIVKAETCAYIVQRLLDALSQPFNVINNEVFITACVGISIFPQDDHDGTELLKQADIALNQAKSRGCNVYQFYKKEMQTMGQRALVLNSSLRQASVYHEFTLYYQPLVNTQTKMLVSMEALLRWQHPEFGIVSAHEFLRLAENSGKIIEIGEWVLRSVCQQYKQWKQMQFQLEGVAVNISLRQLESPHFIYKLTQILQDTNMPPKALVLEISEGSFHKVDLLEKSLKMIKRIGVQIAIDDFGTGNLSLQQFKRFPVDYLKIDRSLTNDLSLNPEGEAIIKMIVALADTLGHGIIAEGVETPQQKAQLEKLGCSLMQGHLFSLPRKVDEFTISVEREIGGI